MKFKTFLMTLSTLLLVACNSGSSTGISPSLSFVTQPSNTTPAGTTNGTITPEVKVAIRDAFGNIITNATNKVTLSIANNPGSALTFESVVALSGTPITGIGAFTGLLAGTVSVHAVHGIATFNDLSINQPGNGYTLLASADGFESVISESFNVVASTDGYDSTRSNDGSEIVNLTEIGESYQGFSFVYIAEEPNPIPESDFATWSQAGWITNTPRHAIFDYSNTLGSPNSPIGPLTQYIDTYGYTWGYIVKLQSFDWPFDPNNYPNPQPTSGWQAGQTQATVPSGVIKYSNIDKNQLYIFLALESATHHPVLRYFVSDPWGNIYTMKSSNKANNTPELITAAFESAVLPEGWTKSMGYFPQDLYGYPIYGESTDSIYNDFRDNADNAYTQIIWGANGNSVAQQIGYPMPIFAGQAGARLNGNIAGNSLMYGSFGDDQFYPESGGNIINGGSGYNGVFYSGNSNQYTVNTSDGKATIVGPNGTNDILTNIQYLQFSDKKVSLDN